MSKWGHARAGDEKSGPPQNFLITTAFCSYQWFTDKDFLQDQYVAQRKSVSQIARELGCSHSTVSKYLYEHDIPVREERLPHYKKSQLGYGERLQDGHVVAHKAEAAVLMQLRSLRAEGQSYEKLARWLNGKGIKTKNGGSRWDRKVVYQVLQRIGAGAMVN